MRERSFFSVIHLYIYYFYCLACIYQFNRAARMEFCCGLFCCIDPPPHGSTHNCTHFLIFKSVIALRISIFPSLKTKMELLNWSHLNGAVNVCACVCVWVYFILIAFSFLQPFYHHLSQAKPSQAQRLGFSERFFLILHFFCRMGYKFRNLNLS